MTRRALCPYVVLASLLLVSSCIGSEGYVPFQLTIKVVNESEQVVFVVHTLDTMTIRDALMSSRVESILPSKTVDLLAGGFQYEADSGGCFVDEQIWIIRSKSGVNYYFDDVPNFDDIEILQHWDGDTCFSQSIVEYDIALGS